MKRSNLDRREFRSMGPMILVLLLLTMPLAQAIAQDADDCSPLLGANSARALSRLASQAKVALPRAPWVNVDRLPYQEEWETLRVPKGKSKTPPLADGSRPERVLYFRPKDAELSEVAVAHSVVARRVVRREVLEVYFDPSAEKYELRVGLDIVDALGRIRKGSHEEIATCLACHSVSEDGHHLIYGQPTPTRFPELKELTEFQRAGQPRWPVDAGTY